MAFSFLFLQAVKRAREVFEAKRRELESASSRTPGQMCLVGLIA